MILCVYVFVDTNKWLRFCSQHLTRRSVQTRDLPRSSNSNAKLILSDPRHGQVVLYNAITQDYLGKTQLLASIAVVCTLTLELLVRFV